MIIITGAAGFIGSVMVSRLNTEGFYDLVLVDDFSNPEKLRNFDTKKYRQLVHRDDLVRFIDENHKLIQFIIHLGARTDTTEFNVAIFNALNLNYSKAVWNACTLYGLPLIYASSAATYGMGELGYKDDHAIIPSLKPLNPYGESKNDFDKWALSQDKKPYSWVGLKFFNVYGPNEYHKGRMASVIFHSYNQIKNMGKVKLFRSHRSDFKDGEQLRDFIYVKDICDIIFWLINNRQNSGIFNAGTGKARSFLDLTRNTFKALNIPENIEFIDTPEDIRDKYQYYTQADMEKIREIGYHKPFTELEDGVHDYVKNYLIQHRID